MTKARSDKSIILFAALMTATAVMAIQRAQLPTNRAVHPIPAKSFHQNYVTPNVLIP